MMNKYKLKGHETFCIREGWLSKGMEAVEKNPRVFLENSAADELGVGANMAKAIRYWLKATGLTKEKIGQGASLTEFGRIIYENDPYLEEIFTLWCLHINLVLNQELATSWYFFFTSFMQEEFKKTELEEFLVKELVNYTGKEEISKRSIRDDCTVLLQMYARDHVEGNDPEDKNICPLSKLSILRKNGGVYKRIQPDLGKFPHEVFLYLLQSGWCETNAINMESLYQDKIGAFRLLGLGAGAYQECLELCARDGFIDINRTAGLDMIYKKKDMTKEQVVCSFFGV